MANGGRIDYTVGFKVDKTGLKDIKASLQELQKLTPTDMLNTNNYMGTTSEKMKQARSDLAKLQITASEVGKAFETAFNPTTGLTNLQKLNTSLKEIGITNISQQFAKGGEAGNKAFYKIAKGALTTNMQLRQTNTLLDKMGQTLGNTIKWGISSSIMNRFVGSVQQAYGYVQHLDTSLNDIRIVTGKSADEMDRFAEKANKSAKALGQSTTAYTEAALIYRQQGLGDEETEARTETTLKAANVTGQTGREVSEQLTAVWNGYKVSAEETELYVDKLAAVAATSASNLEELSTGMSKVASAANNMGVDVDQLNAQLATIISTTRQAPETAGTALKTIYARMEDLKISGEDEEGVKLGEVSSTLDEVGIHVMDVNGDMRDLGEVIEEVGNKWDGWTRAQQSAIAQAIAGKRQYNNLLALFDGWDQYNKELEISRNATGTLQKQQDIYMESTAAHLQQLKTQWEDFYDSLINTDDINSLLDIVTDLVDVLTRFLDGIGGGRNALLMLGSVGLTVFDKQISAGITHAIQSFNRMKNNAAELQAQLDNIQMFKNTDGYQQYEPTRVLIDSLEEVSQYYKILDNEQINQANALAQQVADAKELQLQWEKNTQALEKFQENLDKTRYGGIADKNFDVNNIGHKENRAVALKDYSSIVKDFSEDGETLLENFKALNNEINDEFVQGLDDTIERFNKLKKVGLFDNIEPKKLQYIENSLNGINKAAKDNNPMGMQSHLNNFKDLIEQVNPDLKELLNNLFKVNEEAGNTKFDAATASLREFLEQAKLQNTVKGFVDGFAALGQFASGITSLTHTFDILGNSSLTTKEKVTQFLSSFGMGISMLLSSAVRLPLLIDSLKELPNVFSKIATAFTGWAVQGNKVAIAQSILARSTDEQKAAYAELIGVQNIEEVELNETTAGTIVDTAAKEGNITATEALSGALKRLWATLATNPFAWVAAALAAGTIAMAAYDKAAQERAKHAEEEAEAEYKAAKEKSDALNEEYNNVKKLVDAYKELRNEYDETQVEALKHKIFELSQEYGVNIDMVALMGANYEELDGIMTKLLQDISGEKVAADLETANEHIEAIAAKLTSLQLEDSHPFLEFLLSSNSLIEQIHTGISDIFEAIAGFEPPSWLKNIASFTESVTGIGGFNTFSTTGTSIVSKYNKDQLSSASSDVKGVISVNKRGQLALDEDEFMKYSEEQQKNVLGWLQKNYSENDGFLASYVKMMDHSAEAIEKAISGSTEEIASARKEFDEAQKSSAKNIYTQTYGAEGLTSVSQYETAKKEIAEQLVTDFQMTETEATNLAIETLKENSSYKITGSAQILEALKEEGSISKENLSDISKELDNLSDSQIGFISSHTTLLETFYAQGKTTEEIFSNLGSDLDYLSNQDHIVNIETVLNGKKGSKEYDEGLEKLFGDDSFSLGVSKEEFEAMEESDQAFLLLTEKRNEIENFKKNVDGDAQNLKERNQVLEEEIQKVERLAEAEKNRKIGLEKTIEEENKQNKSKYTDDSLIEDLFGYEKGSDQAEQFKNEYISVMNDLSVAYQEATEKGEDGFAAVAEAMDKIDNKQILDYIEEYSYQMSLASGGTKDTVEATQDLVKNWKTSKKALKPVTTQLEKYNDQLAGLEAEQQNNIETTLDWKANVANAKTAIGLLNKSIDNLQSSYQTMQSITEDFNADGKLSLDNLQALIDLDDQYAAALDIQNGQMSINDATMQQALDTKIRMAKVEVTEAYLAELDAIAHGQATDANKAFIESELYSQQAINGTIDAANKGVGALMKYANAKAAAQVDKKATEQATKAYYNKMQMLDNVAAQPVSEVLGKASSGGSSGASSKEKEADHEDYLEHETDLYRAINEELDDIESTLGRIQEFDDHSWGLTAKKALEQENKLLKQQLDMLEKKKDTYERDLGARRGALESQGINFSEDGSVMTNAEDKINQLYGEYNAMVDKYNAMSADDQESFKETLEAKKDSIDEIEDAIDKYEDGYNDYNSVLDELLDTHYELIENEVNHFNADIDVHLELDEAEQEWNDFWYEVVKDIEDKDFAGRIAQSVGKLNTLIGTVGKTRDSQVAELTNHLNEVTAEVRAQIAAAARGGEGSLFQDDSALSKENLENYRDQLMDAVRTAKEEIDEMADTYLEALDHAKDLIDDQVEGWEAIGDHIEHDLELIQMVSGDKAFDALNKQFEQQYKNNLQLIQTQRMSTEYWQERMKYYEQMMATEQEGSEMYKMYSDALETASENYRKAVSDLDKTVEDALKKLEEWRKNQVAEITDSLDKALSKNMGLEDLKKQWDLVVEEQDYYLDNVERAIEMEGLQNEFDDVLNAMDARGAKQQEFLKWQDEELRKLNEKNKLTQYDIDEVKARLELKRQELALEDAQQNKSNLRLRRDSQGNYTYQYVADEGNVEDAEDKMLTAKREWYELVKKRNEETTNEVIDIRKRLLEAENEMAEALAAHNDEAYENAKARYEFLIEYEKELMEEGEKAKRDFYSGTAEFFADVNDNQILPMWDTTIQQMIDKWDNGGKDSFIGATISAIGDLEEVQRQFGNHTEEILYTAGVNYQDLVERGIDPTTEALEDMQDSNDVLNVSLEETNDLMNQLADELSVAIDAYNSLKDAAVNAIREANDALETLARTAIETSQQVQSAIAAAQRAANVMDNLKAVANSRVNGDGGSGPYGSQTNNKQAKVYSVGSYTRDSRGNESYYVSVKGRQYGQYIRASSPEEAAELIDEEWLRKNGLSGYDVISGYATGGYTGEWNDSNNGRLAFLHQKELVLNESDTTNILNAVKAVRDIVSAQASPNFSGIADSIANMAAMQASAFAQIGSSMLSAIASSVNNNNSDVSNYRNMTVNADFSGVRSADAIYQALRELENYGAQQAYSSAPHANSSY